MERTNNNKSLTGLEQFSNRLAVSPSEAARMLGVSKPKIYDLIRQEDFPAFKLGTRTLIAVDGLRQWVADQAGAKIAL